MSSEGFNPNEALWVRDRPSSENNFLVEQKEAEGLIFEGKPLSSLREELTVPAEEPVEEAVLIDNGADEEALQPTEPAEPMVTLTESDYNHRLAQARAETESQVKGQLEAKYRTELDQLKEQQAAFFKAFIDSLTEDSLSADLAALSLDIGALLARCQLRLDEKVVAGFLESSIRGNEVSGSDFVSVKLSSSWQAYRETLNGQLPDGLGLVFDDALQPGDVVVSAGQGGYFDLLRDRVKMLEEQLESVDYSNSIDWLNGSLRQFFAENTADSADPGTEPESLVSHSDELLMLSDALENQELIESDAPLASQDTEATSDSEEQGVEDRLDPSQEPPEPLGGPETGTDREPGRLNDETE